MCGLIGAYGPELDDDCLDLIAHRGPDSRGIYRQGPTTLGHTRLAIQDPTDAASQPFKLDDLVLTYNGEAWNREALRMDLRPREWQSSGDTEVVAALLAERGPAGLDLIDGMFAVAWVDSDGTWLARDRYGKIPLYVAEDWMSGGWLWASEIKALPYGTQAVALEPGTAFHVDSGTTHRWAISADPLPAAPEHVATLLRAGVRARLLSDRPVCFLLSGGLDSTLVLSLAKTMHPDPVAYTAVYDPGSEDLKWARYAADYYQVPLIEVPVPDPGPAEIRDAVRTIEVPMKAQVEIALANLPLARAISSDGFKVVLSGEGADEMFGGYGNQAIAASGGDDQQWREIRTASVQKMARGNFMRVNKVFMAAGVEARLPFMHRPLVELALGASKAQCPPGKGLLKAAAEGLVPPQIIRRQKQTFQGGCGIAQAAGLLGSPVKLYNQLARQQFGWLPKA